jgi:hypothetical protein
LPEDVEIVGISTKRVYDFSEELSPPVADAVPFAARIVIDLIGQVIKQKKNISGRGDLVIGQFSSIVDDSVQFY